MGLKDLFGKTSEKVVTKQQLDNLYAEAESKGFLEEAQIDRERYLPAIDFSSASNFARYGSAERYYVDAIKNIYQNFPYDGSKKEKQEWRNNASQLDLYIYDEIYPRTTGYLNLSASSLSVLNGFRYSSTPQYVTVKGGPNTSSSGLYEKSNIYDIDNNRESNLGISDLGNTVEFWFKDDLNATASFYTSSYALFDMWNGQTTSSAEYARLTIFKTDGSNKFAVTYRSGSVGVTNYLIDYTFAPTDWHHYAFTFANKDTDLSVCLYVDGDLMAENLIAASGGIDLGYNLGNIAYIGALRADITTASTASAGLGSVYGSFDEFRFWKSARNSQQIYRNWFTQVGGGANSDDSNRDLGLYFKFNEGIVNSSSVSDLDKICLDYSGRVSNGLIVNYAVDCKTTGSAIDDYYGVETEEKDPIILSTNPLVTDVLEEYTELGKQHDINNPTSIYSSLPSWITDEADKLDAADLSQLIQIIASYFDMLHIQIKSLSSAKDISYDSVSKPKPFSKHLLSSSGFENLDIFNDTTFIEELLSRNENEEFSDKLHNVKNSIYQNIYNNLSYIYKTKGTEKSLRNLIRCFGVDDELIKINLYADNAVYDLETKYTYSSIAKKFVDFNDPDRYDGFVYQKAKNGDSNTKDYIPAITYNASGWYAADYIPLTLQGEVVFPKKPIIESAENQVSDFVNSSLFGVHEESLSALPSASWGSDTFSVDIYAVKPQIGSSDCYFKLEGSFGGYPVTLTSSLYKDVYENEKWNFAARVKSAKYPHASLASGSVSGSYLLEFVGINSSGDSVENMFTLSASVPSANMTSGLRVNKRVYAGALHQDYDPTQALARTDVKIGSVRFWLDYLTNEELIAHSFEANNFGRRSPNQPPEFLSALRLTSSVPLTTTDTLALHWNFFNVTASDANGQFVVDDASSGSTTEAARYGLGWFNNAVKYQYPGFADEFYADDTNVVNKEFIFSSKKQVPENLYGNDLVKIVDSDDITRTKETKPINYYISIEKSMAQVVNDEILNWFATIDAYNNLLGEPKERYKQEYSGLAHLRELFFAKTNNRLDFEKFFNFYKWIDSSLSMMIGQLIPASANTSDKIRNLVESHMLERSKYENKLPTIEIGGEPNSAPITSHLYYNYVEQAASGSHLTGSVVVSRYFTFKPQWLKQRAIRNDPPENTALEPLNDIDREVMRQVINERNLDVLPTLYEVGSTVGYDGRRDLTRIFTKVYKLTPDRLYVVEDAVIPVNIQNIPFSSQFTFASDIATASADTQVISASNNYNRRGNYQHSYETVMMSGRMANNKSLEVLEGQYSSDVNIMAPSGAIADRTLPVRETNKNVIVERFSAPGGKEVSSRGYLDAAAEEYSVYNSLNHRNYVVRKVLNNWLAESASLSDTDPSFHKTNKNPLKKNTGKTIYDNGFVIHQIPQSDTRYTWITASINGAVTADAFFSEWDNISASYDFLSGTVSGSTVIDYLGLNTLVVKTADTASNTVEISEATVDLNRAILNRNGPYGWPTWKQIRNAENPIVKISRDNNNILVQDKPHGLTRTVNKNGTLVLETYYPRNMETFTAYREPPIEYNKPMAHKVAISGTTELVSVESSYDNNKNKFANEDLTDRTGAGLREELQTHDIISKLEDEEIYTPQPEIKVIEYAAEIFPSNTNVGLKEIRTRPNYEDDVGNSGSVVNARTFWRDATTDRARASTTKDIYGFADSTYEVLPEKIFLTIYNDVLNNTVNISGTSETRESLLAQDVITDITNITGQIEATYAINQYIGYEYDPLLKELSGIDFFDDYALLVARSTVSSSEGIYLVGAFTPGNIVLYNGSITQSIGNPAGTLYSITSGSNGVYIGGSSGVYLYNGIAVNLISGSPNNIYTVVTGSNRIYAGGDFNTASGSYITQWDGISWTPMSGGLGGSVRQIISSSQGLYATGYFNNASGSYVSLWNGSNWTPLGGGLSAAGRSIVSGSDRIYVGGLFNDSSGSYVSQWNGTSWQPLGTDNQFGATGETMVVSIASASSGVYLAGGTISAASVKKWDGTSLSDIKPYGSRYLSVQNILAGDNKIYLFGSLAATRPAATRAYVPSTNIIYNFSSKGGLARRNISEEIYYLKNNIFYSIEDIAEYDFLQNNIKNIKGNYDSFSPLFDGGYVESALSSSNGLYFTFTTSSREVRKWDGVAFSTLTSSISAEFPIQIESGSEGLYALIQTEGVYLYDGVTWADLSYPDDVNSLYSFYSASSGLYVGTIDSLVYNYTNSTWNNLGTASIGYAIENIVSGTNLYVCDGYFVYSYNGSNWTTLPSASYSYSLLSSSEGLYSGGAARATGEDNFLLWDGNAWLPLSETNGGIWALHSNSSGIYLGGAFTTPFNHVARWDGTSLKPLGRDGIRNGVGVNNVDFVLGFARNTQKIYPFGYFEGTRSGPLIKDKKYNSYIEAFATDNILMPTPVLTFNNFIPPSYGASEGMNITEIVYDENNNVSSITEVTGNERIQTLNEGYVYEVDTASGKKPFHDSYDNYLEDIKPHSAKYSLVPEYTISDYVKAYVTEKNGIFDAPLEEEYLKLDGALQETGFNDINDSVNSSRPLNTDIIFDSTNNNEDIQLSLKISGIKKLLPHRGFYPSERVVTLGSYFINSFLDLETKLTSVLQPELVFSSSLSNGTPINQQILTLLQPMMSPGILMNTIKSSIAVDWPAFITSSVSFDSQTKPEFYENTGSELITRLAVNSVNDIIYNYSASNFINQEQNFRFPFESLIEFDTQIPQSLKISDNNLYYLNPTYYTSDATEIDDYHLLSYPSYNMGTGSLKSFAFRDNNYKLAMHNFLAEVPNFFMQGKLTNFVSQPQEKFKAAQDGVKYYMDVVLERDSRYKEFIADPYYEGLKAQASSFYNGVYLLPSPDSLYGPPTRYWDTVSASAFFGRSPYNFYSKLLDTPAYAPYVPPYYYGKAIARICFTADANRQYSLEEIQNSCSIEYVNTEASNLFKQRSNFLNGNFTGSFTDHYSSSPAYKQMMKVSSSVNLLMSSDQKATTFDPSTGKTTTIADKENINPVWVIQTKFETPSINFINADLSNNIGLKFLSGEKTDNFTRGIYSHMFKGMWTTYGQPVRDGEGIKLYIQESFEKKKSPLTGSLIDLCGFTGVTEQKKTIGLLAEKKTVTEGVVAIPYTFTKDIAGRAKTIPEIIGENGVNETSQRGRGPYYYMINPDTISKLLGNLNMKVATFDQIKIAAESSQYQNNSIVKMILSMTKYVIPPHLDWLRNKSIAPFVMYIADFETIFDKTDLSDIWQGVMPKQATKVELDDITLSHSFTADDFFHGLQPMSDTRFKVFKVKQRANINYYKLTDDSRDDTRFQFTFGNSKKATIPEYSYNWPYDYFSTVELVNIEAKLTGDNRIEEPTDMILNPATVVEALIQPNSDIEIKNISDRLAAYTTSKK